MLYMESKQGTGKKLWFLNTAFSIKWLFYRTNNIFHFLKEIFREIRWSVVKKWLKIHGLDSLTKFSRENKKDTFVLRHSPSRIISKVTCFFLYILSYYFLFFCNFIFVTHCIDISYMFLQYLPKNKTKENK